MKFACITLIWAMLLMARPNELHAGSLATQPRPIATTMATPDVQARETVLTFLT